MAEIRHDEGGVSMLLPVESKQIAFCSYNEDESTLHLYFHTGDIVAYPYVDKEDYRSVLESTNRYDTLMQVTQKGHYTDGIRADGPETGVPAWQDI
jgi:hypothetical protein